MPASSQRLFIPERGVYKYQFQDLVELYQDEFPFLSRKQIDHPSLPYKITKHNQFQLKDWYQHDWFALQELFQTDLDHYVRFYKASSFSEAKKNHFATQEFNSRSFHHKRSIPTPREWAGLNHPPLRELEKSLPFYSTHYAPINYAKVESNYFDPKIHQAIDEASNSELSFGNKIVVLEDSKAFEEKKRIIRAARKTIFMSSLVFVCDPSVQEITDLLIEKRREGVEVRIMVDWAITRYLGHSRCINQMSKAGIEVLRADDFYSFHKFTVYHTKNLIVDSELAITGGHNMIDADNTSRGTDFKNRDIDILVSGPMVSDIAITFLEDWNHFQSRRSKTSLTSVAHHIEEMHQQKNKQRENAMRGAQHYATILGSEASRMSGVCRYIKQSPYEDGHSIGKAYLIMLDQVQSYLAITNPIASDSKVTARNRWRLPLFEKRDRFVMFNKLFDKIQGLASKGTKIDYITTGMEMTGNEVVAILNDVVRESTENGQTMRANWAFLRAQFANRFYGKSHFKNLVKDWARHPSVDVWTHVSFIHSKIFHFDRIAASVGSYNFQHNATDHSYEGTVICQDESLNRELDRVQVLDMANSIPLVFKK